MPCGGVRPRDVLRGRSLEEVSRLVVRGRVSSDGGSEGSIEEEGRHLREECLTVLAEYMLGVRALCDPAAQEVDEGQERVLSRGHPDRERAHQRRVEWDDLALVTPADPEEGRTEDREKT